MNHFISSPVAVWGGRKRPVAKATPFHAANVLMSCCSGWSCSPNNHISQIQAVLNERW
jgi:hypothetical protein